eukprot:jgi/Mesvir1/7817/Mv11759-RA.1
MSYRPQDCQHFSLATLRKKWKVGLCDHYTMEMAERHGKVQPRKRMPAKDRLGTPARSRAPGPARAEAVLAYPLTPVETEAAGGRAGQGKGHKGTFEEVQFWLVRGGYTLAEYQRFVQKQKLIDLLKRPRALEVDILSESGSSEADEGAPQGPDPDFNPGPGLSKEFMEENVMGVDRQGPYLTFEFKGAVDSL